MITGIGTDICSILRIEKLLERNGQAAAEKILAPGELEEFAKSTHKAVFLAKRFAAKEALGKALGIGVSPPATLQDSAVSHDFLGKPIFVFAKPLAAFLAQKNAAVHLSISDEKEFAIAFVVIENEAAKQELFS